MAADIGELIFLEILQMTQYPGAPFTGNIVRDLILFLFVPSVFMMMFVIVLLGRIITPEVRNLRILVGIAIYMFVVASGYYGAFALIAGPYFIFLIFILGVLYFIPGHFALRARGGGGGAVSHLKAGFDLQGRSDINEEIKRLQDVIRKAEKKRDDALAKNLDRAVQAQDDVIMKTEAEIDELQKRLRILPRYHA